PRRCDHRPLVRGLQRPPRRGRAPGHLVLGDVAASHRPRRPGQREPDAADQHARQPSGASGNPPRGSLRLGWAPAGGQRERGPRRPPAPPGGGCGWRGDRPQLCRQLRLVRRDPVRLPGRREQPMNSRVRRSAAPTALALLVAGLSLSLGCTAPGGGPYGLPACTSDAQCQPGEQCFSDGCGDLGGDLAAEVSPEARAGQFAQDFAFETVGPIQDFRVVPTTALSGILRSASTEDDEGHVTPGQPYVGRVTLQLAGTSSVIPGLHRSANLSTDLSDGRFTVPAPSGTYVGTLTTADPRFPPLRFEVEIAPG